MKYNYFILQLSLTKKALIILTIYLLFANINCLESPKRNDNKTAPKEEYREFYKTVLEIIYINDPIGINFGDNPNEYEPEVDTIIPRLDNCKSVDDVHQVVYEEFVHWFDKDIAGSKDKYRKIAEEIWDKWNEYKGQ